VSLPLSFGRKFLVWRYAISHSELARCCPCPADPLARAAAATPTRCWPHVGAGGPCHTRVRAHPDGFPGLLALAIDGGDIAAWAYRNDLAAR
jgi:hypothetical protein